uniref:Uncharacterized protein n=1 Tax=Takifugu rubripes TaxID=31033 RepID=A0A674NZF3_TAKRU
LAEEVAKLQKHLALLRQGVREECKQKLADTERRSASTFISRLLDIVADLYLQEQYR